MEIQLGDLPAPVTQSLNDFIETAQQACGEHLISIVLFGSAAEGRLRPSSDVNLLLVLKTFEISQVNQLREKFRFAHAAIRLNVMFLLENEITVASEAFAVKFQDILSRHKVLFGPDPFAHLTVSREATIDRLKQVIVNLLLRMRERYVLVSLREEQLVPLIAEVAGPLRASAATLLSLEGQKNVHPKEALQIFTQKFSSQDQSMVLKNISLSREEQKLKPGEATATFIGILELLKNTQEYLHKMK